MKRGPGESEPKSQRETSANACACGRVILNLKHRLTWGGGIVKLYFRDMLRKNMNFQYSSSNSAKISHNMSQLYQKKMKKIDPKWLHVITYHIKSAFPKHRFSWGGRIFCSLKKYFVTQMI